MAQTQSQSSKPAADGHGHGAGPKVGHVVSPKILVGVYAALLVFTVITYAVSKFDLGSFNIIVALAVAVVKASLVALFFMHLRWDSPFNSIVLVTAFFFVALFIGLALLDSKSYQDVIKPTPVTLKGP